MGLKSLRVYFDACIAIYLVEEHPTFAPLIEAHIAECAKTAELFIQVSELTEMECLVLPLRKKNQPLLDKFRLWFDKVEVLPVTRAAFQQAAQLRAAFAGLKTPDAVHLATALHYGSAEFWTNDNRLSHVASALVKDITTV